MMDSNFSKKIVFPKIKVKLPNKTDRHYLNRDAFNRLYTSQLKEVIVRWGRRNHFCLKAINRAAQINKIA